MMTVRLSIFLPILFFGAFGLGQSEPESRPPNILFAISDDQSYAHTSFAGSTFVNTPAFDRVAREGVYFADCIAASPGCAPSRNAIVTGRYPWQNEQAGQHASAWLKKYVPFIDVLQDGGYSTGRTGKGVGPFQYARDAQDSLWRTTNAAGVEHSSITYEEDGKKLKGHTDGISQTDYYSNFKYFMENVKGNRPFFFWYGAKEPHRRYEKGSWKRMGKQLKDVKVPRFLPDNEVIRGDLLDYAVEIEWFDRHLQKMLDYLEDIGELENTIVIVTSDNGKPFPRAKANSYEYGIHVPMAVRYPKKFPGGRVVDQPISFVDLAPTILEIAGKSPDKMMPMTGKSLLDVLVTEDKGIIKDKDAYVFSGRERHSSSRYGNWGYPQRAIRSRDYLYIWNMKPERWPAGAPQKFDPEDSTRLLPVNGIGADGKYIQPMTAFTDIDDCPTKTYLLEHANKKKIEPFFELAVAKRPEFELFDIRKDPYCLENLAGNPEFSEVENRLKENLLTQLKRTEDPRVVGPDKEVFDSYQRYSPLRKFPKPDSIEADYPEPIKLISGPDHHWFGYYDKLQIDPSGRYVLGMKVGFEGRSPVAGDTLEIGMVDLKDENKWIRLGKSNAWGWQQGCMLQWRPGSKTEVVWNDREGDAFVTRILDIETREMRTLPKPVYTLSSDGSFALGTEFNRIQDLRPGYGYPGIPDPYASVNAPEDIGIYKMDLETGENQLLISIADMAAIPKNGENLKKYWHYFNHLLIAPDNERFVFLHRYRKARLTDSVKGKNPFITRMFSADTDGSDLFLLDPSGHTSHFIWNGSDKICAWTRPEGEPTGFYMLHDRSETIEPVGKGIMTKNGHNTYIPNTDNRWILNDTYPDDERKQELYLYDVKEDKKIVLGRFFSPEKYKGEYRCDLHPRPLRDGNRIIFDSTHDGDGRQMYMLDIESKIKP